jgi:hypothetical protein
MLIGNKCDLGIAVDERLVEWARLNNVHYIKTSVKNDINVNKWYGILSETIYRKPTVEKRKNFTLSHRNVKKEKAKQKSCC